MDAGLKQLKVISRGEDGGWEWVPVSGGHRDKRVGECAVSAFIQFDSEGVLSVRKPRVSSKDGFKEGYLISARLNRHHGSICSTGKGQK